MKMSLSDEEEYLRCVEVFLQASERLRDGWRWEEVQDSGSGFLKKTVLRSVVSVSRSHGQPEGAEPQREEQGGALLPEDPEGITGGDENPEGITGGYEDPEGTTGGDEDPEGITGDIEDPEGTTGVDEDPEGIVQVLQMEYNILFSCSYSTPVLYFRGSTLGGRSLSLEEVWSSVHPNFRRRLQESRLNTISQQEHPLLAQPFFMLHPCRTQEFMQPLRPVNYLISWLSVVGPVVGLEVPLKYSTDHY